MNPSPKLYITSSTGLARIVSLERLATLGRGTDNTIVLDEISVSRYHAMFVLWAEQCFLLDLESTNGSTVNGRPALADAPVPLANGDIIGIGEVTVRYENWR